ncbi:MULTISPECIES: CPBP family intramembrane glutamic endopeptidase [Bacillus]|uniref:CPBP family intramembrane metalloprotease n=1 Tax=Bacillus glycinifermentans TaxID=1664069 RepID=A0AAJ4D1B8_9BACI|nr:MULTISPECIES: CPBP family intramembrane glutamic endopeptidase [Bacillus]MDU0071196.1 CPBP family intramembrane glutamic endopeptidase [Bacillus sp. IG6]MED8019064.1 CPBP family intramembrane metalloprotease [Bacillus glycinifermentans]QAT63747.1 CPBP family intramembrane metalloprotease [Bacillus glycinifermentans]WKB77620.1 CPBP family intramembrane metalloprotease [Bacillus glycinifermentans]SCA84087.1 sporulation-killing factor biosynthesis protein SkfC [Bacillus glycinifermentans]
MTVLTIILWISISVIGLLLFHKFKPLIYQSLLLDKDTARLICNKFIKRYVGIDVTDWDCYAMYWYDHDTVNKLHHLGLLNKVRQVLYHWGLVESWRIRFVNQNKSIIAGVNSKGEITFFHADVPRRELPKKVSKISPEQLKLELAASNEGLWSQAEVSGAGEKEEALENITTYWYIAESDNVRMKMTVELHNGCILSIGSEQEILTEKMGVAVKKEHLESTLGMTGVIGSLIAVIAAIMVLINMDSRADVTTSMILGGILICCNLLTLKEDIQLTIVNAYDSRISVKMVYIFGTLSTILAGLSTGFVVFICSLAGNTVGYSMKWSVWDNPASQVLSGISIGLACLGLSAAMFTVLEKKKLLRISPELSNRTVYLSGFTFRQGLNISLQSSLSEETVYRLLMIPTIWLLTDNMVIAVLVSSVLWAIMHQGTGYHPRWIRWLHLTLFGCLLGFVFLQYGFISVLAAHFIHNLILVCKPLWDYKVRKKLQFGKNTNQSSF